LKKSEKSGSKGKSDNKGKNKKRRPNKKNASPDTQMTSEVVSQTAIEDVALSERVE
jgi:hypothetical protein